MANGVYGHKVMNNVFLSGADEGKHADRTFKLASILEVELKDLDRAIELYSLVLKYDPQHDEAFDRLRSLSKLQKTGIY